MVREDGEVAGFHRVLEMLHGLVYSQQFVIVDAVFLLCCIELLAEEGEGLSDIVNQLLQYGTRGRSGSVRDECKWRIWVGVCQ
jgi:hypothetical protein